MRQWQWMKDYGFALLAVIAFCGLVGSRNAHATDPAPLTGGATSGTYGIALGTSAQTILPADGARKFLEIQNTTAATNILACTLDGTTPSVNANGISLQPYQIRTYDTYVPTGALKCIGSAGSTGYYVNYTP